MTNETLIREYLDWQRDTRGRAGVTLYDYASVLEKLAIHVAGTPLAGVRVADLERFVQRPRRGGKAPAPASAAKDAAICKSLFSYLHARGLVATNPATLLYAPSPHNKNPKPIPDGDWVQLWEAAHPGDERYVLGVGFACGLRRRELCELTVAQVAVPLGQLIYFKRKGGGDDVFPYTDVCEILNSALPQLQLGPVPAELAAHISTRQARGGGDYVLSWGQSVPAAARERAVHSLPEGMTDPNMVNRRMAAICERAGTVRYTPHQLRHSFVTNLLRAGVPLHLVTKLANHSSPAITDRYVKAGGQELREWMRNVNRHS